MDLKQKYQQYSRKVIEEHAKVFEALDINSLRKFMDAIKAANKIVLFGHGREGISTRGFAMRLKHMGKEAYWLTDDTTPHIGPGDLFIFTTGSSATKSNQITAASAVKTSATFAVVTSSPNGIVAKESADIVFYIPAYAYIGQVEGNVPTFQPMGNLFEQNLYMMYDIVIMLLAEEMGITFDEMESRHRNIE